MAIATAFLQACSGTALRSSEGSPSARFDPLVRFVPRGMESLWLDEFPNLDGLEWRMELSEGDPAEQPIRAVHAGRRFRPMGIGYGDHEGVSVIQYRSRAPAIWSDPKRTGARLIDVAGRQVLFTPGETGVCPSPDSWTVVVGVDTLLSATRRELLDEALSVPGDTTAGLAAKLGWSAGIPWDAPTLVFRNVDQTNREDLFSPSGVISNLEFTVTRVENNGRVEVRMRARTNDLAGAREWLRRFDIGGTIRLGEREWKTLLDEHEEDRLAIVESGVPPFHMPMHLKCVYMFGYNLCP